jgi:hypothetical protein
MVHIRVGGLALPAVICIAVAVTSCSSAPGSPASTSTPEDLISSLAVPASPTVGLAAPSSPSLVPSGYRRVGGVAQGISVAVPASWVAVNLARQTIESAAKKLDLSGVSATAVVQNMESLQKSHAVFVYDLKSAVDSPQQYARTLAAYCAVSGVTDVGASGVPFLQTVTAAGLEKVGATHVTHRDLEIGGVPGVETFYTLTSTEGALYGSQLEVLPKPDKLCLVTLTVGKGESRGKVLSTAAATAQFP